MNIDTRSLKVVFVALALLSACAQPPQAAAGSDHVGSWQIMPHIKLATFSADDSAQYNLMIFCDPPGHVRVYHYARPEALGEASNFVLRSGSAELELDGMREEDRMTPPPNSADPDGPLLGFRVHARVRNDDPVMRAFLRSGALEATSGEQVTRSDADPAERDALAAFFNQQCA